MQGNEHGRPDVPPGQDENPGNRPAVPPGQDPERVPPGQEKPRPDNDLPGADDEGPKAL